LTGFTFDAGGLIAYERRSRELARLLARLDRDRGSLTIPAPAAAQVVRNLARQSRIARLLRERWTRIVALDEMDVVTVGRLLAASHTDDVVDAHVVLCARHADQAVVTSDPDDLRRIDPDLAVVAV
jgi:predicted nucleic acid-binding protein